MALYVDIEKRLGDFTLQVKFEAQEGVLAFLGASGCGKSMTLKCIAGIVKPDRGRIELDGRVLFDSEKHIDLPPQKRRVGYLFQNYALFPNMTVAGNIRAGLRGKENKEERLKELVAAMGLEGLEEHRPHQLSGGQQQRTALARILASEPEVLLLDEPFSALDSHLRFRMEQQLRQTLRSFGKPAILVSHDRDEVFRLASHVALLRSGRMEALGSRDEVFASPRTRSGAMLTGCKNISAIRKLSERRVLALDWGMELTLAEDAGDAEYVGIRMHSLRPEGEVNRFVCRVEEEIENPFSFTIMLCPEGQKDLQPIGWEMDKEQWRALRAECLPVCLPPEGLLLLKG